MRFPRILSAEKWQWMWSRDWVLRFVSLVLAGILWYLVGGEDKVAKNVMIPVEIINMPRDLVISNQFKKQIEVTVNGPRSAILEMSEEGITRQVDLSHATPGTNVIVNENDSITVPRGVTVERIQPSTIILSLDKLITKRFPIRPTVVGKVPTDYKLVSVTTDPDEIPITGPNTVLGHFDVLTTGQIDVKGLKKTVQRQVPLDLSQEIIDLIGETSVTANIKIGMKTVKRLIKGVPVHVDIDGIRQTVTPDTVSITANVPRVYIKHKMKLGELFHASGVQGDEVGEIVVKVVPKEDVADFVTILKVTPSIVRLHDVSPLPKIDEIKQTDSP